MTPEPATYPGYRFPAEVIRHAVWLYHLFGLSLRDIELILTERGVVVSHESIRRWDICFGAGLAAKLRKRRPRPGDTWHLDEVFLRINGALHYLWRAVDQHGVVLDILVQDRRNATVAKRFFKRLLHGMACDTIRGASSRTACGAAASRDARSCRRCGTVPAGT